MHIVNVEQRSPEWKALRANRVMASDGPVIMGLSPYLTAYELWQQKIGLAPETIVNKAMKDGIRNEDKARRSFEKEMGVKCPPVVVLSDEYPWLGASLDGLAENNDFVLEIKCNGEKNHAIALKGEIPPDHYCQMQVQMVVTNIVHGVYYSYDIGTETGVGVPITYDAQYCADMLPKLKEFHRRMMTLEAPTLTDVDYRLMNSEGWSTLAEEYVKLDREIKAREEAKDVIRKQLIVLADNQNSKGNGVKLQKCTIMGKVSYENIPELRGMDLEPYRKPASTQWRITIAEC